MKLYDDKIFAKYARAFDALAKYDRTGKLSNQNTLKSQNPNKIMAKVQMITISKKEYEGMKETIEILQDPNMLKQILESDEAKRKGVKTRELKLS